MILLGLGPPIAIKHARPSSKALLFSAQIGHPGLVVKGEGAKSVSQYVPTTVLWYVQQLKLLYGLSLEKNGNNSQKYSRQMPL